MFDARNESFVKQKIVNYCALDYFESAYIQKMGSEARFMHAQIARLIARRARNYVLCRSLHLIYLFRTAQERLASSRFSVYNGQFIGDTERSPRRQRNFDNINPLNARQVTLKIN